MQKVRLIKGGVQLVGLPNLSLASEVPTNAYDITASESRERLQQFGVAVPHQQ